MTEKEKSVHEVVADPKRPCRIQLRAALWAGLIVAILVTLSMIAMIAIAGKSSGGGAGGALLGGTFGMALGLILAPFVFIVVMSYVMLPVSIYNLIACKDRLGIDWFGLIISSIVLFCGHGGAAVAGAATAH